MSCLKPTQAWQDMSQTTKTGAHPLVFSLPKKIIDPLHFKVDDQTGAVVINSHRYIPVQVPCGQCILCRQRRAYEITVRAVLERLANPDLPCSFITLTVDDDHMEEIFPGQKLQHRPWQLFAKRLRKSVGEFRYLMCGEYGEKSRRPHYHAILFGMRLNDRQYYEDGTWCDSSTLKKLWPFGNIMSCECSDATIAYVAGYQLKLEGEEKSEKNYVKWSRNPGLGYSFIVKYPDFVRICRSKFDDGFIGAYDTMTFISRGRSKIFFSRYFMKVMEKFFDEYAETGDRKLLRLAENYDNLLLSKGRRLADGHLHNLPCGNMQRAMSLKNRAEIINQKLANKLRDVRCA